MDSLDEKIINLLKDNSRVTFTKMAEVLGVSEGSIRKRTKSLVKSGLIKRFTVDLVDDRPRALVLVSTSPSNPTSQIAKKFLEIRGVELVLEVTGEFDISIIVSGNDVMSINQCIDKIRSVEGVIGTNTLFVLKKW